MQHETHRVPVTALAIWANHVALAGKGNFLFAYDLDRKTVLATARIFADQPLHGIVIARDCQVLVYGGRLICRVRLSREASKLSIDIGSIYDVEDWILDASFSQAESDQTSSIIALVTAHNALLLAKLHPDQNLELVPAVSGSNCILYCACIKWLSPSRCLVASGTAFGDVIVWSCQYTEHDDSLSFSQKTHYAFSAHEGSVFGVELSEVSQAKAVGAAQCVLATCSDDRTIRIWDVSDLTRESPTMFQQQQETGFGVKGTDDVAPSLLSKAMGHVSRIWHVRLFNSPIEDRLYVLSFGEDAQCILWRMARSTDASKIICHDLTQLRTLKVHSGKNIWALAVHSSSRIVTGGADGAIAWFEMSEPTPTGTMPSSVSHSEHFENRPTFRVYGFLSLSRLLAVTDRGQLFTFDVAQDSFEEQAVSRVNEELRGYSIMASVPGSAFVAGAEGTVYYWNDHAGQLEPLLETDRKVAGLFVQQSPPRVIRSAPGAIDILVTNMGVSDASFITAYSSTIERPLEACTKEKLTLPIGFVVTSFATIRHDDYRVIIIGSRNGAIALYKFQEGACSPATHHLLVPNVHGKESITQLLHYGSDAIASQHSWLFSTGRDGTYAAHTIDLDSEQLHLTTRHQLQLPFGPNVVGIGTTDEAHLWVWGFRGTSFVVFDLQAQQEIMAVECGGVHRNWTFQINGAGGTFVWTKASKLYHTTQIMPSASTIDYGGHGREIKCLAVSPTDSAMFATGAEDTDIKLNRYDGDFRCIHTLQRHVTGIQHLQWSEDGAYLFSSGGFEEFFVWHVNSGVPVLETGVVCESRHPNSGTSDLRIMNFDVEQQSTMEGAVRFFITMVYSDSTVRAWQYQNQVWELLATGQYLTSCLTQCTRVPNSTAIMTGSTDGHLAMWCQDDGRDGSPLIWTQRHRVHQSAILSLISLDVDQIGRVTITGGDDNAIGITLLGKDPGARCTLLIPQAHAAAVTALAVVHVDARQFFFASASLDQRVKLWHVVNDKSPGVGGFDVKLVANAFTAVADASSLAQIGSRGGQHGVMVAGVGLDVLGITDVELLVS